MNIRQQLDHAVQNWHPNFRFVATAAESADSINQPHEDYPRRVLSTQHLIYLLVDGNYRTVTAADCLNIHKELMADRAHIAGKWRTITVKMRGSNYEPPHPMHVAELAQELFPFAPATEQDLRDWYTRFQCIHPFDDGNGRVGGIIVAALSRLLFGKYLTPCQ